MEEKREYEAPELTEVLVPVEQKLNARCYNLAQCDSALYGC